MVFGLLLFVLWGGLMFWLVSALATIRRNTARTVELLASERHRPPQHLTPQR